MSETTHRECTGGAVTRTGPSLGPGLGPEDPRLHTNRNAGPSMTERRKTGGRRGASMPGGGPTPALPLILSSQTTIQTTQSAATTMDLPATITLMIASKTLLAPTM